MNENLFSLKTEFYIGLVSKSGERIWSTDATKDIKFIFAKHNINSFSMTAILGFYNGEQEEALIVTVLSVDDGDDDFPIKQVALFDKVAENFRTNFRQNSVLVSHSEIAGKLIEEQASD